jgi:hypothetical protein
MRRRSSEVRSRPARGSGSPLRRGLGDLAGPLEGRLQGGQHQPQPPRHVQLLEHGVAVGEGEVAEGGGQVGEAPGVAQVHAQDARHLVGDAVHPRRQPRHGGEDALHHRLRGLRRERRLHRRGGARRVAAVLEADVLQPDALEPLEGGLDGAAGEVQPVQDAHGGGHLLQRRRGDVLARLAGGHDGHQVLPVREGGQRLDVGAVADLEGGGSRREDDGAPDGEHRDPLADLLGGAADVLQRHPNHFPVNGLRSMSAECGARLRARSGRSAARWRPGPRLPGARPGGEVHAGLSLVVQRDADPHVVGEAPEPRDGLRDDLAAPRVGGGDRPPAGAPRRLQRRLPHPGERHPVGARAEPRVVRPGIGEGSVAGQGSPGTHRPGRGCGGSVRAESTRRGRLTRRSPRG